MALARRIRLRLVGASLRPWGRRGVRDPRQCLLPLAVSSRGYSEEAAGADNGRVTGPRHYPSLAQTLRNTRGRELLRIVDTAVPNLRHPKEFSVVLKALALDGQWRRALRLVKEMKEVDVEVDLETYNQVLAAMAKDKQVEKALGMLTEMREQSVDPDIESYAHCVGACKPAEWQRTLEIMDGMAAVELEPDGACFEHAAAACEEAGEWQRSLTLFLEIGKRGLESTSVGHNYALSACRQGKQWRHGMEIMGQMALRSFDPDFRLRQDLEAQSRGLDRAPPPEPSHRSTPSPDNIWQRKQQLRELREQDKRKQEERRLEQERLEREPAPEPYEEAGFMVYGGRDAFPHRNAHQMAAVDLATCRKFCQDKGYGAFIVWNGQAFFRSETAEQCKDNLKRAANATLYLNLETDAQRKARLRAEEAAKPPAPAPAAKERKPAPARDAPSPKPARPAAGLEGGDQAPAERRAAPAQRFEEEGRGPQPQAERREAEARWESRPQSKRPEKREGPREPQKPRPKLRSPGSYVLPVFAQHDRSNHAERQALIKVIARVQEACDAQTDEEFERECAEVTGTVRLYASHTPCISCMACFCQFQRLFPKVKLCVDFDDWRDTRRMVEMARREDEYKRRGITPPTYDCPGLSDMSDEEDFPDDEPPPKANASAAASL